MATKCDFSQKRLQNIVVFYIGTGILFPQGGRGTGTLVHKAVSMSGTGDLLEHRTDESDAYDTLYIGCEKFLQHDVFAFDAGDVM